MIDGMTQNKDQNQNQKCPKKVPTKLMNFEDQAKKECDMVRLKNKKKSTQIQGRICCENNNRLLHRQYCCCHTHTHTHIHVHNQRILYTQVRVFSTLMSRVFRVRPRNDNILVKYPRPPPQRRGHLSSDCVFHQT